MSEPTRDFALRMAAQDWFDLALYAQRESRRRELRAALDDAIARTRDVESQVQAAEKIIAQLEKSLAASESSVEQAKEAVKRTSIISPIDGIVTFLATEVGELAVQFNAFVERMQQEGIAIAKIYSCPYHPKGKGRFRRESVFRKPGPGIFKMAQQEFELRVELFNLQSCEF